MPIRLIVAVSIFVLGYGFGYGQSLGQDKEGFSSIVNSSFNLSLDVANEVGNLSIYQKVSQYKEPKDLKPLDDVFDNIEWSWENRKVLRDSLSKIFKENQNIYNSDPAYTNLLLGVDITGGSENGISSVFSDDKVASKASLFGFIGVSKRKIHYNRELLNSNKSSSQNVDSSKDKKYDALDNYILYRTSDNPRSVEKDIDGEVSRLSYLGLLLPLEKKKLIKLKDGEEYSLEGLKQNVNDLEKLVEKVGQVKFEEELNNLISLVTEIIKLVKEGKKKIDAENKGNLYDLHKELERQLKLVSYKSLQSVLKIPNSKIDEKSTWEAYKGNAEEIKTILLRIRKEDDCYSELIGLYNSLIKIVKDETYNRKTPEWYISERIFYLRGGPTGNKFRLDLENDSTTVDGRFPERDFQSYQIELGGTWFFKRRNYFGASVAMSYTDNLDGLEETAFTLQKVDGTINEGTFSSSEQVKAFSGSYDKFMRYDFNLDYARLFTLKEKPEDDTYSHLYLSLNPYLRHRIYEDADVLKNNTVLGLGAHAFNSKDNKLMGGAFIQTEDLFGVHKDDEDVLQKGITFGLIVKYNFDGLKPPKD